MSAWLRWAWNSESLLVPPMTSLRVTNSSAVIEPFKSARSPYCTPNAANNGGCRTGYTCDIFSGTCVEACLNTTQCEFSGDDVDKKIGELKALLKDSSELILATDEEQNLLGKLAKKTGFVTRNILSAPMVDLSRRPVFASRDELGGLGAGGRGGVRAAGSLHRPVVPGRVRELVLRSYGGIELPLQSLQTRRVAGALDVREHVTLAKAVAIAVLLVGDLPQAFLRDDGIRVAAVRDPFGNRLGIIENPHFQLG